jgi:protein-disulfide isomerase
MNEEEFKSNISNTPAQKWGVIVAILFGAWIIGMSIVIGGWIISKEIAKNDIKPVTNTSQTQPKLNVDIPNTLSVLGNPEAKVTIVEFADFQCPFCGEWQKDIFPKLKSDYIDQGKVKFVFYDYAFLGLESKQAALAARCANDQGKFWEYHDKLYENQKGENEGAFSDSNLKRFATELNLNTSDFSTCFNSQKYLSDIEGNLKTATVNYQIDSTPTIVINGNVMPGVYPYEAYQKTIDAELSK